MTLKDTLTHAVTAYDRKQSTKRFYNHYALAQYFERIEEICADVERGADVRKAVVAGFSDRLLDHCLRALNMPLFTREEQNSAWGYSPVSK